MWSGLTQFVLGTILCGSAQACGTPEYAPPPRAVASARLSVESTIGDVLEHRAFAGFARLLLPWDDRSYDTGMRLRDVASLLPYHSEVSPAVIVASLNRLIDDVDAGHRIFHDIYTETQKRDVPARRNVGLFFVRGRPGAPFALIAPGGGFAYVGSLHEGFPYAVAIAAHGMNAFVIKYRVGQGGQVATEDMAAALSWIVRHADTLGVAPSGYALWGSSAGARMAALIGSHGADRFGGDRLPPPATIVMLYTGHADVGSAEPATFVAVGDRDGIAPPESMARRIAAVRATGAAAEFHRYPNVAHGFGLGAGTSASGWLEDAMRFWTAQVARASRAGRDST
ncbi:MAG: alpha/beta hydrolase [Gemmatimonadota bacterium]